MNLLIFFFFNQIQIKKKMCIYISYVLFIQYVLSKYWYLWQMQMILMTKNRWRKCIFIYLNALKERILNISPNNIISFVYFALWAIFYRAVKPSLPLKLRLLGTFTKPYIQMIRVISININIISILAESQ